VAEALELVIFDCDGVLVDSEPIAVRTDLVVLARVGLQMSEAEVIERFLGRSPAVMTAAIEQHLGHALPEDRKEAFERLYTDAFEHELVAVEGVQDALERISLPTCVASSSEPDSLRRKLELTGLYERFAGNIFSASEVANGKPAPDLFLHAAARMGAIPARCVVVEDSRYGVQAARAAEMDVLAYAGGLTPAQSLVGASTTVFYDMNELPKLIEQMDGMCR
jgi:HAD superfamily hydrolase (TIGR01509 family)